MFSILLFSTPFLLLSNIIYKKENARINIKAQTKRHPHTNNARVCVCGNLFITYNKYIQAQASIHTRKMTENAIKLLTTTTKRVLLHARVAPRARAHSKSIPLCLLWGHFNDACMRVCVCVWYTILHICPFVKSRKKKRRKYYTSFHIASSCGLWWVIYFPKNVKLYIQRVAAEFTCSTLHTRTHPETMRRRFDTALSKSV